MIIKASLLRQSIAQVPVTLWPDRRGRAPHLRPWRDGWRHLRYLLMLSPYWLFAIPAMALGVCSLAILMTMLANSMSSADITRFGNYWAILAGSTLTLSHIGMILALTGQLYGIREKYRPAPAWLKAMAPWLTLEAMLTLGLASIGVGLAILTGVVIHWSAHALEPIASVLPAVIGTCALTIGMQNILGGFLLAIVSGNNAEFVQAPPHLSSVEADPVIDKTAAKPADLPIVGRAARAR
jgi:hypothetical protein